MVTFHTWWVDSVQKNEYDPFRIFSSSLLQVVSIQESILGHSRHRGCIPEKYVLVIEKVQQLSYHLRIFKTNFILDGHGIEFLTGVLLGRKAASALLLSFLCRDVLFLACKAVGAQHTG